ncbi:MAG: hypothetical protein M1812_006438 [Candelaria pacifica]|nr:MAG: hypothetical protein M1812_006438 [Candelaria pacifica]
MSSPDVPSVPTPDTVQIAAKPVPEVYSPRKAWLTRNGSRFGGPIFSLCVGEEEIEMFAHQNVLAQSPVLGRFCTADFKEKEEQRIVLEDDDPIIFGLLLE